MAVAAGSDYSLALKSDGTVMIWGLLGGDFESIKQLQNLRNVTKIEAGGMHVLFLTSSGSVWSLGQNQEGQLGSQDADTASETVRVSLPD